MLGEAEFMQGMEKKGRQTGFIHLKAGVSILNREFGPRTLVTDGEQMNTILQRPSCQPKTESRRCSKHGRSTSYLGPL